MPKAELCKCKKVVKWTPVTSDDIPAMLSDGEFVMTGRAVRGAGSYEMQADPNGIISLMPTLEEDRERGMDLMYKMMDTFANKAKAP